MAFVMVTGYKKYTPYTVFSGLTFSFTVRILHRYYSSMVGANPAVNIHPGLVGDRDRIMRFHCLDYW